MQRAIDAFLKQRNYPEFSPKAFLFDMDGVLFDSMSFHAEAWEKAMKHYSLPFTKRDAYLHEGRTGETTINEFFPKVYSRKATKQEVEEIYQMKSGFFQEISQVKPVKDVLEFLQNVKNAGLEIFIVTGSAQTSLLETLNEFFPDIFQAQKMVTAFDVRYGKPDPEPYLMALEKGNFKPWEAVVVENAPLGVRSAVGAGIFTIAVNTGILDDDDLWKEGANAVLPDMKTLIKQWKF